MIGHIIFISLLGVILALTVLMLISGMIYDLQRLKLTRQEKKSPSTRNLRRRPLVSIVIMVNDKGDNLKRCLRYIGKNNYKKYELVVISKHKSAALNKSLKEFTKQYPSKKAQLVISRAKNIQKVVAASSRGQFIFVIDSGCILNKNALHNGVRYFALNQTATTIYPNLRTFGGYTIKSTMRQFEDSLGSSWHKLSSVFRLNQRHEFIFYKKMGKGMDSGTKLTSGYCSDVVVYKPLSHQVNFCAPRIELRSLFKVLLFATVTYSIYLALAYRYTSLLAMIWIAGFSYLAFEVWSDDQFPLRKKLSMVVLAPLACALFYLTSLPKLFTAR
jgi:hypothetical protein